MTGLNQRLKNAAMERYTKMASLYSVATLRITQLNIAKAMKALCSRFRIKGADIISHVDSVWYHHIHGLGIIAP